MREPSVINFAPKTVRYVTQEEFEKKADLYTAKYRRLLCVLLSLLIFMVICFAITLTYAHISRPKSGFSCVQQPTWKTSGTIKYDGPISDSDNKNMPDFDSETGTFTAERRGMYHVTYSFDSFSNNTEAGDNREMVRVLRPNKAVEGDESGQKEHPITAEQIAETIPQEELATPPRLEQRGLLRPTRLTGRSFSRYYRLDKKDTLQLECLHCDKKNYIEHLHFCVAFIP